MKEVVAFAYEESFDVVKKTGTDSRKTRLDWNVCGTGGTNKNDNSNKGGSTKEGSAA